jgi:retron-type reverse transcriptase
MSLRAGDCWGHPIYFLLANADSCFYSFRGNIQLSQIFTLAKIPISSRLLHGAMLMAGSYGEGRLFPTERGTPQGGVISPLLSNILLTPFDRELSLLERKRRLAGTNSDDSELMSDAVSNTASGIAEELRNTGRRD